MKNEQKKWGIFIRWKKNPDPPPSPVLSCSWTWTFFPGWSRLGTWEVARGPLGSWPAYPRFPWLGSFVWSCKKNFQGCVGFQNFFWAFKICIKVTCLFIWGSPFFVFSRPPPSSLTSSSSDSEETFSFQSHLSQDRHIRNGNLSLIF